MYMVGLLDYCINKIMPCGEVCLTLNTLIVFLAGLLYHFLATIYGLYELGWGKTSECLELEMFKLVTGWIYFCWFSFVVLYAIGKFLWHSRKNQDVRTV